ncbi:flavodoxin family protein [Spirochaetota bacterium]
MSKTLILYYSRTGKTKAACEALGKKLGADIVEIKDLKNRAGKWGFFCAVLAGLFNIKTSIEPERPDMSAYGNIIIASPIWGNALSMAIRAFLSLNQFDSKNVIFLTTVLGHDSDRWSDRALGNIKNSGGRPGLCLQITTMRRVKGKRVKKSIEEIASEAVKLVPEIEKAFS